MGSDDSARPRHPLTSANAPLFALVVFSLIVLFSSTPSTSPSPSSLSSLSDVNELLAEKSSLEISILQLEAQKNGVYSSLRSSDDARAAQMREENKKLEALLEEQKRLEELLEKQKEEQEKLAAVAPATTTSSSSSNSSHAVFTPSTPGNPLSSPSQSIVNFPCPLRDSPPDDACTLKCKDATCSRAETTCSAYVECTHIVYSKETGGDMSDATATLMHEKRAADTGEMRAAFDALVSQGKLGTSVRPRIYVIVSYGGSGSKMLSGWINDQSRASVKDVRHMHDPNPPNPLRKFGTPLNAASHQADYRDRHIPGGMFPGPTAQAIPESEYEDYR
jgi:hypothetical protein